MQTARALLILGIWVAILPYLGFPVAIKNILFVATGLTLVYFSLLFYKQIIKIRKRKMRNFDNFSESNPDEIKNNKTEEAPKTQNDFGEINANENE